MKQTKEYEEDYHAEKHEYLCNNEKYYCARAEVARYDFFKGYKLIPYNLNILDFGCGMGNNIYGLGEDVVGYDSSKFAVDFCRKKGIKATSNIKEIKDNHFDVVLLSEVLEHVENPLTTLELIKRKLVVGGHLILVLPVDKWNKPDVNDKNQHLYNWNFNTITNLLIRAGFYPVSYEIMRRTGFYKLLPFNRIHFRLYLLLTKLAAIISGSKHMKIVAIKR